MTKATKKKTEEKKEGISVILGGKEYILLPLVISESREWRKQAMELITPLTQYAGLDMDNHEDFVKAITELTVNQPDKEIDLFFAYAKDLNREEIESVATEVEIAEAFTKVFDVIFAPVRSLGSMLTNLSQ